MDGYPTGSLDHNVPFIVATGLNSTASELPLNTDLQDQGILLRSEQPLVEGKEVEVIKQHFEAISSKGTSWTGVSREESYRFRIKSVGRVGGLKLSLQLSRTILMLQDSHFFFHRDVRDYPKTSNLKRPIRYFIRHFLP